MGNGVPNNGNPAFHFDYAGNPIEWRYPYHHAPGVPNWVWSDWMPIATYHPVHAAAWQSASAFHMAMLACPSPALWSLHFGGDPQAQLVFRGACAQTLPPVPLGALNLPP